MKFIRFSFLFVFLISLNTQAQFLSNLSIQGKISNAEGPYVYLSELGGGQMIPIDSVKVSENGSFMIHTNITKPNFFQISNGGKQYAILVLEPNENLIIDLNTQNMLQPSRVEGSVGTEQLYKMLKNMNGFDMAQKSLEEQYQKVAGTAAQDSVGKILAYQYEQINQQRVQYIKQEIASTPSLATLLFIDKIEINENVELYVNLDKALYPKYKDNSFVSEMHDKVAKKLRLAPGSLAPEIKLRSPEDVEIALSSLRGKVVLVDFWAAWCSPCRKENPNNVRLYEKYHSKGFEIYAVSLDKQKSDWIKAIADDKLPWIHVSDLRYWSSQAGKDYGVGSIPFTVLIDAEGKIIETGLRGAALEQKLQQLFGE
jgi:peroxiredoxin